MSFLETTDGVKIYYNLKNKKSTKEPIIFIHGYAIDHNCFSTQIKFFKKEGYPVIYFDLRGHGKSKESKKPKEYSFKRFIKDIEELLEHLKINKKVIIVGYSLGGMISLRYAKKNPNKIKKMVLIDTADKAPEQSKLLEKIQKNETFRKSYLHLVNKYSNKKRELLAKQITQKIPELFFVEQVFKNDPETMIQVADTIYAAKKEVKTKIPTLIIASKNDQLFSKEQKIKLQKNLSKSIIKFFPGGHEFLIKEPKIIFQEIKQFIHTKEEFFNK